MGERSYSFIYQTMYHKLKSIQKDDNFEKLIQERLVKSIEKFDDQEIFEFLCQSMFSGGFNSSHLSNVWGEITNEFNRFDVIEVNDFRKLTVGEFLDRFQSFKNYGKIIACIQNAETFIKIQTENGDFKTYIKTFLDLEELATDLITQFSYLGPTTVYEFLREIGFDFAKPDVHLRRIMHRLGFLESGIDNFKNRGQVHLISKEIAHSVNTKKSVIDAVFWLYGSGSADYVQYGICTEKPKCDECDLKTICKNNM